MQGPTPVSYWAESISGDVGSVNTAVVGAAEVAARQVGHALQGVVQGLLVDEEAGQLGDTFAEVIRIVRHGWLRSSLSQSRIPGARREGRLGSDHPTRQRGRAGPVAGACPIGEHLGPDEPRS